MAHFIDEYNIVTYVDFDSGFTLYLEYVNREIKKTCRSTSESPKCIPSNDQLNSFVDEELSSNVFVDYQNLCDVDHAAPLLLNHSHGRELTTLQCSQTTTQQQKTGLYMVFFHWDQ